MILFDNAGVASSSGETPGSVETMADHARDFVNALCVSQLDLLGFSIGGYVAQAFTSCHPNMVKRLILVGTARCFSTPSCSWRTCGYSSHSIRDVYEGT